MANFPTHIAIGTIVSGGLATVTLATDVVGPENLVAVTLAGVLGSVLPDIDLKDSRPSRAMFSGLAVFFAFAVLFSLERPYSVAEMMVLWLGTLVAVRYLGQALFYHFSYHRGIWHSLLAALFAAFFTAVVYRWLLGRPDGVAWLAGVFMLVGFLTHLILDELYSVDVSDTRIKASFGTALKLIDAKHPGQTSAMAVATVLAFLLAPPTKTFIDSFSSRALWTSLQHRLLPQDKWFGVDWRGMAWLPDMPFRPKGAVVPAVPAGTSGISTGSIAPAAPSSPDGQTAEPKPKD
jgi:membrane-bound metal-dependent hydrolase YbcI (DUF457 family)